MRILAFAAAVAALVTGSTPSPRAALAPGESIIVSTEWLAAHLSDPSVVVLNVDHDATGYRDGHIPGARFIDYMMVIASRDGLSTELPSASELRELVREADVRIYSIGLLQGSHLLERISNETGGRMIHVHKLEELPDAIEKLSRDLRSQYLLGYYSSNPQNDGRYRKVQVQVNQPESRASWRHGYYAPLQ